MIGMIITQQRCSVCGGNIAFEDDPDLGRQYFCFQCGRPYNKVLEREELFNKANRLKGGGYHYTKTRY